MFTFTVRAVTSVRAFVYVKSGITSSLSFVFVLISNFYINYVLCHINILILCLSEQIMGRDVS